MPRDPRVDPRTVNLTGKERRLIADLLQQRRRHDSGGRATDRFSATRLGSRLLSKLKAVRWVEHTGWFLSGVECYRLSATGVRAATVIKQAEG